MIINFCPWSQCVEGARGTHTTWYEAHLISLQVFHDTEHNLHQLGAENSVLPLHPLPLQTHTHTHRHTHRHIHRESALQITGRKGWWLTMCMCSKVRNTQTELAPCHRAWWVVLLMYVPYRWSIILCHLCPAGAYKNIRYPSEMFCLCLAEAFLSGLWQAFVTTEGTLHYKQLNNTDFFSGLLCKYSRSRQTSSNWASE